MYTWVFERGNFFYLPLVYQGSFLSLPVSFTCPHCFWAACVVTSRWCCFAWVSDLKNPTLYYFTPLTYSIWFNYHVWILQLFPWDVKLSVKISRLIFTFKDMYIAKFSIILHSDSKPYIGIKTIFLNCALQPLNQRWLPSTHPPEIKILFSFSNC